jgi:hypothetical protein
MVPLRFLQTRQHPLHALTRHAQPTNHLHYPTPQRYSYRPVLQPAIKPIYETWDMTVWPDWHILARGLLDCGEWGAESDVMRDGEGEGVGAWSVL